MSCVVCKLDAISLQMFQRKMFKKQMFPGTFGPSLRGAVPGTKAARKRMFNRTFVQRTVSYTEQKFREQNSLYGLFTPRSVKSPEWIVHNWLILSGRVILKSNRTATVSLCWSTGHSPTPSSCCALIYTAYMC